MSAASNSVYDSKIIIMLSFFYSSIRKLCTSLIEMFDIYIHISIEFVASDIVIMYTYERVIDFSALQF